MKENVIHINGEITINVDASVKIITYVKKIIAPYACENWKYLASIMDDSVITCDEVLESYNEKTIEIKESNFISTSPFVLLATRIECYSVCIIKPFYYL